MAEPFFWGAGGQKLSATEVARNRAVAEALMNRVQNPQNMWEGLQSAAGDIGGSLLNWKSDKAEEEGRSAVADALLQAQGGSDPNAYISILGNEFASPAQSAVAQALLQRGWSQQDRAAADAVPDFNTFEQGGDVFRWNEKDPNAKPELWFDGPDQPSEAYRPMTPEERAGWGIPENDPTPYAIGPDNLPKPVGAGKGQTINVGGNNDIGTIPPGYAVQRDQDGNIIGMSRIPGGPADAEAAAADAKSGAGQGRKDTATDTITNAASIARELAVKPGNVGVPGAVMGINPETQAAELRRQVSVLTSNATIENLTAMRQASPTGGALGSVTEKEGAMLAAAAGAIDPNAAPADFIRALDTYERTLLRIVHGPEVGDQIFNETRATPGTGGEADAAFQVSTDAEYDALPSGAVFVGPDGKKRRKP